MSGDEQPWTPAEQERVRRELGSAGMVAGDLLPELPRAMKELRGS